MLNAPLRFGLRRLVCGLCVAVLSVCSWSQVVVARAPQQLNLQLGAVVPFDQIIELAAGDSMEILDLALRRVVISGPYKGRAGDLFATAAPKIDTPTFQRMASVLASAIALRGGSAKGDYRHLDLIAGGVQCAMTTPPAFRPVAAEAVERASLTPAGGARPQPLVWRTDQRRFDWPADVVPLEGGRYEVYVLLVQSDGLLKTARSEFTLRMLPASFDGAPARDLRALLDAGCNAQVLSWAEQIPTQDGK